MNKYLLKIDLFILILCVCIYVCIYTTCMPSVCGDEGEGVASPVTDDIGDYGLLFIGT